MRRDGEEETSVFVVFVEAQVRDGGPLKDVLDSDTAVIVTHPPARLRRGSTDGGVNKIALAIMDSSGALS